MKGTLQRGKSYESKCWEKEAGRVPESELTGCDGAHVRAYEHPGRATVLGRTGMTPSRREQLIMQC